ncbi:MAG: hypothetical protein IAE96_10520 [Chitinophagaceae bacterium]|nr:hypothetical protein [Chitinophagaceae bacterium]
MKKLLFFFFLCLSGISRAQPDEQSLIREFLASADFNRFRISSPFGRAGDPDPLHQYVKMTSTIENEVQGWVPVVHIGLTGLVNGRKKLVGEIQAVKVKESYTKLPQNGTYLLLYRDLTRYDLTTDNGEVRVYDLNYDSYLVGDALVKNGKVVTDHTYPMPPEVAGKYQLVSRAHPCDANQNGNITFGECWRCFFNACKSDPECELLCKLINKRNMHCTLSIGISCAIIAAVY